MENSAGSSVRTPEKFVAIILKHLVLVLSGEFLAMSSWSLGNCLVITDMVVKKKKQDDHRVGSLPLLIKKSLWSSATSKYPRCLHPARAVKWAGEAGIKRHGRQQHAFTAACQTDTEHKRDKSLHYLWKWLNHQEKPALRSPGTLLYSKFCFLLYCGKETSFRPIFWRKKPQKFNWSLYKIQQCFLCFWRPKADKLFIRKCGWLDKGRGFDGFNG